MKVRTLTPHEKRIVVDALHRASHETRHTASAASAMGTGLSPAAIREHTQVLEVLSHTQSKLATELSEADRLVVEARKK